MTVTVVGTQLGDEGKGGIVDVFGDAADVVARYQGGDNAGHTVVHEGDEYKLSLVPSGAIRGKTGVLGNGCVVNPATLFEEIDALRERGLDPDVRVAERAHAILPYHRVLDGLEEGAKSDDGLDAGTTGRGIGPTYEDKAGRRGIRIGDLLDPDVLRQRLDYAVERKRAVAKSVYGVDPDRLGDEITGGGRGSDGGQGGGDLIAADAFDVDALFEQYRAFGERLEREGMTVDAGTFLQERHEAGDRILFEGAQGTGIDIDHGIYPFVTSSNPTAGAASVGTGVGPTVVGRGAVVGVIKAYLSRVGTGPLPTELGGETDGGPTADGDGEALAERIREEGGEFGTVTGRPRRVGWLDLPMCRHAARTNGLTHVAINHVDVLAGLDEVRVAVGYELDGGEIGTMPPTTEKWGRCRPIYRTFEGWPTFGADPGMAYADLPENARTYVDFVAEDLGATVCAVGVGPGREQTIVRERPFDAEP
jgi:adenylosuccinate synthase